MAKEQPMEVEGVIAEALKDSFRVEISPDLLKLDQQKRSGVFVLAKLSGKLRNNNIRVVPGDKVRVEVSPYDMARGRITYRIK